MKKETSFPLSSRTINNNIFFLQSLKKSAFNDNHPGIDKMVKNWKNELKKREQLKRKEVRISEPYGEQIVNLKPDEVFVFGSNPQGFSGAGAAGYASFGRSGNIWRQEGYADKPNGWKGHWNVKGVGEGLMEGMYGKSYALPTVVRAGLRMSLSKEQIITNIKRMYACAEAHLEWRFLVAGSSANGKPSLNGYSHDELCEMYKEAGPVPVNVVFSDSYTKMIFEG